MTAVLTLHDKQDWTVDDLAHLPSDLRYELIDGRLLLPSPTGIHQILGVELVVALRANCPKGYSPVPDYSMRVDRRNEPRPDIVVIHNSVLSRSPAPIERAILAVEVVSRDSHFRDMHVKAKVYAAAGIGTYLIVDPLTFTHGVVLTEFRLGESGSYDIVTSTSETFETDTPYPVKISVKALTVLRDEYLAAREEP